MQTFLYYVPVTHKRNGQTSVYRHPESKSQLVEPPSHLKNMQSQWRETAEKYSQCQCLEDLTYSQVNEITKNIGSWLIKNGHKIFYIHSKNRLEWSLCDIACLRYGVVTVPLYDTLGKQAMQHTFDLCAAKIIGCSQQALANILKSNPKSLNHITTVVLYDQISEQTKLMLTSLNISLLKLSQIIDQKLDLEEPTILPDQLMSICFTSGTTGIPKGVMLTHRNFLTEVYSVEGILFFNSQDCYLSYLPLAHLFERALQFIVLHAGARIRYYSGSMIEITKDYARIKPTIMPIVPRLLNMFYNSLRTFSHVDKTIAEQAWNVKKSNWQKGIMTSPYDDTVFKVAKDLFGGRLRFLVTGSAPVSVQVLSFFRIVLGVDIREAYGQTQTVAPFFTRRNDFTAGHVGGPIRSIEFKLVDIPQMNFSSEHNPPTGEICLKGGPIFIGYYKDEKNTRQTIDKQGWHHSGDVGLIQPNGALRIIDRKKNIFKLSQGLYVAPQKIQNIYRRCSLVTQVFLYGDSLQRYPVAIIVPNKQSIEKYAASKGIEGQFESLCENSTINRYVLDTATSVVKKQGLFGFEIAKKIMLHPVSFAGYGIFTTTMKMQRHVAKRIFQKDLIRMYKTDDL